MAKYGHLNLNWMQVGREKRPDGYCFYDIVRGGMDKGVGLTDLCARWTCRWKRRWRRETRPTT